jgi:hypothetical protein
MIQVLINPDIPPPAVAVEITRQSCRNLKSKKTEGGEYNLFVEVSVNSKEENSWDFCLDFLQEFHLWTKQNRSRYIYENIDRYDVTFFGFRFLKIKS